VNKFHVFILSVILFSITPASATETGTPDPTPTPKITCGGIPCTFYAARFFSFGLFDDESFATLPNLGQFCQPLAKGSFDTCRVPGKNAIPTNNLNKVILKNGWVDVRYAPIFDLTRNPSEQFPPEFHGIKITVQGADAVFGPYPVPNFTFASDRKTVYIKAHRLDRIPPSSNGLILQINPSSLGKIRVSGYLETSENTYSEEPSEVGTILVVSKYDEFKFQKDKKTNQPLAGAAIKKFSICYKGKVVKKVLQKDLESATCPTGFKVKS